MQTGPRSELQGASSRSFAALARSHFSNPNESPRPYMQPTDLKAIARDAALRGDTKTLFHTLDLLERLLPIAAFMDFAPNLTNSACRGSPHGRTETFGTSSIQQHFASARRPGQLSQSQWLHGREKQIFGRQ